MDAAPGPDAVLTPQIQLLIHQYARKLKRNRRFKGESINDLTQQLTVEWLTAASRYDPARGDLTTFVDWVLRNASRMLTRARHARKRGGGRAHLSLDRSAVGTRANEGRLVNTLTDSDQGRRIGRQARNRPPPEEIASRVQQAVGECPLDLRTLAIHLMEMSEAQACERLGISRRQIRRMKARIRERLERHDLDEFL